MPTSAKKVITEDSKVTPQSYEGANCDLPFQLIIILGYPGADSGGEGKSKRAEKYGTKKSKERREEPLGTMSVSYTHLTLPTKRIV